MIKLQEKYIKKGLLKQLHAHISWKIIDENYNQRGAIFLNWRLTTFNLEFKLSIGKSGINIDIGLWGSVGFYYCWAKLKRTEVDK